MSANASVATAVAPVRDRERGHRSRVAAGYILFATLILALTVYGFHCYTLGAYDRPFSPKSAALRPSGTIGLKLGWLGVIMFLIIFLYPLRKHWSWLMKKGNSRHWLDYHVIRSEEHTSELQSLRHLVCRLLLEKKKKILNLMLIR